jgi:hypothetical protein
MNISIEHWLVYLTSSRVNWAFLTLVGQFKTRVKRGRRVPKKAQFT